MNKFILEKFVIISDTERSGNEFVFDERTNVIVGENESGKSSLSKSILYTLGCDVYFENDWANLEKVYLLFFKYNGVQYAE